MQTAMKIEGNTSGITPCGNHILVKPDPIEKKIGNIEIPDSVRERHQQSIAYGYLIAVGPDCFTFAVEDTKRVIDGKLVLVEQKVTRFAEPFAEPGDRISYAIYQGRQVVGEDGEDYVQMNDTDITSRVTDKVKATSLEARIPVSQ